MSRRAPRDGVRTFPIPGQRTAEVELPEIAKAWQPYMLTHVKRYTQPSLQILSSDIRNESNCRYVLKARRLAIEELESVGWDGKDLHDIVRGSRDKEGAKRLVGVCVLAPSLLLSLLCTFGCCGSCLFLRTLFRRVCSISALASDTRRRSVACNVRLGICFLSCRCIVGFLILFLLIPTSVRKGVCFLHNEESVLSSSKVHNRTAWTYIVVVKLLPLQLACALIVSMMDLILVMGDLADDLILDT